MEARSNWSMRLSTDVEDGACGAAGLVPEATSVVVEVPMMSARAASMSSGGGPVAVVIVLGEEVTIARPSCRGAAGSGGITGSDLQIVRTSSLVAEGLEVSR